MKNVNQLVMFVQSEGFNSRYFVELFNIINTETIIPKANSFKIQLKGNVDCAISDGYELLIELTDSWDGTGNFHSLYKISYTNLLKNMVKYVNRKKRKHETNYDISLSESVPSVDDASPIIEVATDQQLQVIVDYDAVFKDTPSLEKLIESFQLVYPEQAGVINLMLGFAPDTPQSEKTRAYCEYFCVQTYTPAIQKRVSRSREAFKKFLVKNNYPLTF